MNAARGMLKALCKSDSIGQLPYAKEQPLPHMPSPSPLASFDVHFSNYHHTVYVCLLDPSVLWSFLCGFEGPFSQECKVCMSENFVFTPVALAPQTAPGIE